MKKMSFKLMMIVILFLNTNVFDTNAYIIFFDNPVSNYQQAQEYCQLNFGTDLATVTSIQYILNDPEILIELQKLPGLLRGWIGLKLDPNIQTYSWSDGTQCEIQSPLCTDLWSTNIQPLHINNNNDICVSIGLERKSSTYHTLITMPCTAQKPCLRVPFLRSNFCVTVELPKSFLVTRPLLNLISD